MGLSPQHLVLGSCIGLHSWDVWWLHTTCTASQVLCAHMVHVCAPSHLRHLAPPRGCPNVSVSLLGTRGQPVPALPITFLGSCLPASSGFSMEPQLSPQLFIERRNDQGKVSTAFVLLTPISLVPRFYVAHHSNDPSKVIFFPSHSRKGPGDHIPALLKCCMGKARRWDLGCRE